VRGLVNIIAQQSGIQAVIKRPDAPSAGRRVGTCHNAQLGPAHHDQLTNATTCRSFVASIQHENMI
jgi:hypothetical protein